MKHQIVWMWLMVISLFPSLSIAQTSLKLVSKADALAIVQRQFVNQDVDYYLLEGGSSLEWRIFVDAEPMKGWGHNAYMVTMPKSTTATDLNSIVPKIVSWQLPVQGNFVPLQVKNRYGNNATSKPRVKKSISLNGNNEVAGRTYAIILNGGSVSFEKDNEINSVAVSPDKQLKVCFKSCVPKLSVSSLTSVSGGEALITAPFQRLIMRC